MKNKKLQYRYSSAYLIRRLNAITIDVIFGYIIFDSALIGFVGILGILGIFLIFEILFNATPGMLLMNLRVKSIKKNKALYLILRKFINSIEFLSCFLLFLLITPVTPGKISLSDRISKCFIVYKHSYSKLGKNKNASAFISILTVIFYLSMLVIISILLRISKNLILYVYDNFNGSI